MISAVGAVFNNQPNYPFCSVNNLNVGSPFVGATSTLLFNGPFLAQANNVTTFTTDLFTVSYLNTMNALTSSGKMIVSTFKAAPNATWNLPLVNNAQATINDD